MDKQITTVAELFDLWASTPIGRERGSSNAVGHDIGAPAATVRAMRLRNSINKKHGAALVAAARVHAAAGINPAFALVTADLLLSLNVARAPVPPDKGRERSCAA